MLVESGYSSIIGIVVGTMMSTLFVDVIDSPTHFSVRLTFYQVVTYLSCGKRNGARQMLSSKRLVVVLFLLCILKYPYRREAGEDNEDQKNEKCMAGTL